MGRRKNGAMPPYCLHRQRGLAYVSLNGRQIMLGRHGSPESWAKYHRAVAEWRSNGCRLRDETAEGRYRVDDLCADYLAHCAIYYRRLDGSPTPETDRVATSFRELLGLYRDVPAATFGLAELKTTRETMVRTGLARTLVNDRIGRIVRAFGWAAEELKIPAAVFGTLRALRRLKRGRSAAHETDPVRPVAWEDVEPVLDHVSPQVRAMILLQWHSGMRPGEVVQLRPCDIDQSVEPWIYRPKRHKTEHHGKAREIGLGPNAREVLRPFLQRVPSPNPERPLFSPIDAMKEKAVDRRAARKTKLYPSHLRAQARRRKVRPSVTPRDSYDVESYRRAIAYGVAAFNRATRKAAAKQAEDAGMDPEAAMEAAPQIHTWSPNQLRHSAATRIRRSQGNIDDARVVLGHSSASTTAVYAEVDRAKAMAIMERHG